MSKTLEQLEHDLATYKKEYEICMAKVTSDDSRAGIAIDQREGALLLKIEKLIDTAEQNIRKRLDIYSNLDTSNAANEFEELRKRFVSSHINLVQHKDKLETYARDVGSAYSRAKGNFEAVLDNSKEYKANRASMMQDLFDIASVGLITWLKSTQKIINALNKIFVFQSKIAKAVAEASIIKGLNNLFSADLLKAHPSRPKDPLEVQNNLENHLFAKHRILADQVANYVSYLELCVKAAQERDLEKVTNPNLFNDLYYHIHKDTKIILQKVSDYLNEPIPSPDITTLQKEFERMLWVNWLPSLKSTAPLYGHYPNGRSFKAGTEDIYDNSGWSKELRKRISDMAPLDKIGVGKGGLNTFVSENDIKLLIKWAESYKPQLKIK